MPLVGEVQRRGGLTYANKPMLFEARVAYALAHAGVSDVEYEYSAGVGSSKVDFRLLSSPAWLVEAVSIGRSDAVEAASFQTGNHFGTILSSPRASDTMEERKQSEEGEALLVVQKIGEKLHDGSGPTKFPVPARG